MKLRIYIRKKQALDLNGNPIIYVGQNSASLKAVPGAIPNNDWIDATDSVANLEKLTLEWSIQHNASGGVENGSIQIQKGVSNSLQFEGNSYKYIREWLVYDNAASLNVIEVRIEDTDCSYYEGYMIKSDQLSWCEDGLCTFDITLRQQDPLLYCIRSTPISDNHQGWFPYTGTSSKKHPRFSYCVEQRPNALLVIGWFNMITIGGVATALGAIIGTVFNIISAIVNIVTIGTVDLGWYKYDAIPNAIKQMLVEGAGCGREHPAPLIRDYITNICDKCGIHVDETTAPIFFADTLTMTTSTSEGQLETFKNPYKYSCYLNAPQKRGIRRFDGIDFFGSQTPSNSYWIPENAPLETLDMFLNRVKDVFNAEWRITNKTLYFNRKDQYLNETKVYDFSNNNSDRSKIVNGVCYEPFTVQMGAYCKGLYTVDAIDTSGNEGNQSNGLVSFADSLLNPNYSDTPLDKTTQFSAARFRLDGGTTDYIMDAMQVVANGQILQPWLVPALKDVARKIDKYANYALLMAAETTFLPKILIWDGYSYDNARCIGSAGAVDEYRAPNSLQMVAIKTNTNLSTGDQIPEINYKYPFSEAPLNRQFRDVYPPQTQTLGSSIAGGSRQAGLYEVTDYFGGLIDRGVARLVNYPMFFGPQWRGTMFDRFHFIDDPRRNPKKGRNWSVKIALCCDDIQRLKLNGDGSQVQVAAKVGLPDNVDGRIMNIVATYDGSNDYGKYIELKGEC